MPLGHRDEEAVGAASKPQLELNAWRGSDRCRPASLEWCAGLRSMSAPSLPGMGDRGGNCSVVGAPVPTTVLRPRSPLGTRRVGAGGARQEAPKRRRPIHPKTRRSVRRRRHSSYVDMSLCSFSDELMSEEPASPTPGQWSPATGRSTRREVAISMYRQIAPGPERAPAAPKTAIGSHDRGNNQPAWSASGHSSVTRAGTERASTGSSSEEPDRNQRTPVETKSRREGEGSLRQAEAGAIPLTIQFSLIRGRQAQPKLEGN